MKLLDAIEILDCDQYIKDNLLYCVSKGLEQAWNEGEFSDYVFVENDVLDEVTVEEDSELWTDIRDIQHSIVSAYG